MKIDELSLSTMTYNALRRGEVQCVKDLLELGSERVYRFRQIGAKGIQEISAALSARGHRWTTAGELRPLSPRAASLLNTMGLGDGPEQRRALARVLRTPVGRVDPLALAAELEGQP
jgi:hypothetical protein